MKHLLDVKKLVSHYGQLQALREIDFYINEGEIVSLIGSNGAGKSTTLKSLSGLMKVTSGEINFFGKSIVNLPPHQLSEMNITHVPEGRRIFPDMTVEENLLLGAFNVRDKAIIKERMEKGFEYFPILKKRLHQKGGTMSGGEQQMLAIARALMNQPKLLMLDEPSMGLAPIIVDQIFTIIQELNKSGITILLVEQNAYHALQIANRGYVLQNGEVILTGTGKDLIENDEIREAYLS
ncbi:MAG: putative branched-chain amino acid transporter ATP-binding protein [Bacillales bacterium]|jgi:branched-chain amino acid transport system ATP-binding protein|nr:putative branched-chain amino acid transporter ATP-binding protein [Bacillales bacterium]